MKRFALLAAFGLSLVACTSPKKGSTRATTGQADTSRSVEAIAEKVTDAPAATDRWNAQRAKGIDFVAMGNEPFWSLEVDAERGMRFKSIGVVDSLNTPLPQPNLAQDAPVVRYRAVTEAGELVVTIAKQPCVNDMSGEAFLYTVTVLAKTGAMNDAKEFTGCGVYLGDYRLNDIWVLESLDGQAVENAQFPKDRPYFEIHLSDNQLLGFAGCNRVRGKVTPEREGILFGPLVGTKMACPAIEFEQKFIRSLSERAFKHRIENRRLTLENRMNTLVFKKVD
ncbi:MAG: META domain-containing protein [Ferruginibacter sp.]|nr:META domain-containing protein [Cytophagales bacterium]